MEECRRTAAVAALCLIALLAAAGCGSEEELTVYLSGIGPNTSIGKDPQKAARIVLKSKDDDTTRPMVEILWPKDETVFPADFAPPLFRFADAAGAEAWFIDIAMGDEHAYVFAGGGRDSTPDAREWTPSGGLWQQIRDASARRPVTATILGVGAGAKPEVVSRGSVHFTVSADPVAAPIFYRDVPLPFIDAVKELEDIEWRLGSVSRENDAAKTVLTNLPVCGNCHSFSLDGSTLAMDVDYANDKGSFVIAPIEEETVMNRDRVITWSDYRREDGEPTFGLLSAISPDGRYVISTVKDRSVFVPMPDLHYSQLFFPIKGILVVYDRMTGEYSPLPGAADPRFVQSSPTWSPDGQYVMFAREEAYELINLSDEGGVLLTEEEVAEFTQHNKEFKFDLYRVPFNDGRGGEPEPVPGASNNGMSNFFPKYSPDGKWVIFTRAANYMLLQPDSELYIIPAEGGTERRLACNTDNMNSWHSWSPNGTWLVFASKVNTAYTELFLTHINEDGTSTPPVLLHRFTDDDRAANIPEFVDIDFNDMQVLKEQFLDDYSYFRQAMFTRYYFGDSEEAIEEFTEAVKLNPRNVEALGNLGLCYYDIREYDEAKDAFERVLEIDPDNVAAASNLGAIFSMEGNYEKGGELFRRVLETDPGQYTARINLAVNYLETGGISKAEQLLTDGIRLDPDNAEYHFLLGDVLLEQGERLATAADHTERGLELDPTSFTGYRQLGELREQMGDIDAALDAYKAATDLDGARAASVGIAKRIKALEENR